MSGNPSLKKAAAKVTATRAGKVAAKPTMTGTPSPKEATGAKVTATRPRKVAGKADETVMIHARIARTLKVRAEEILAELGLNSSDAIRLFYSQVALRNGLPFEVHIPNATTAKALRDIDAGRDVTRYGSAEELLERSGDLTWPGPEPRTPGRLRLRP